MSTTPLLWKPETQVNTADAPVAPLGTNVQTDAQVIPLNDGPYAIVWTDGSRTHYPDGTALVGQLFDAQGNPVGGEERVTDLAAAQSRPAVTELDFGVVAVAFMAFSGVSNDIYVQRLHQDLSPAGLDVIDTSISNTTFPAIAELDDGYVVAYTIGSGGDTDIVGRLVSTAGVVGAQFTIHDETDNSGNVELARLRDGGFVAVYQDEHLGDPLNTQIRYRIFSDTGTPEIPSRHVPGGDGALAESDPDVAAFRGLESDGFVVVWTEQDGDADGEAIRATVFDRDGDAIHSDILVNTSQAGDQNEASVVALDDGGFLVTWEDDFANLVRAQRFDEAGNMVGREFTVRQGVGSNSPEATVLENQHIVFAMDDQSAGDVDVVASIWDVRTPARPSDVLWQHVEGSVAFDGEVFGNASNDWQIRGTGDFDGDGDGDILWQHVDGQVVTWEMEDRAYLVNHNLAAVGNAWQIRGTGDFDGDGDADIVWHHDDGLVVTWEMEDGNYLATHSLASVPTTWQIQGTGDHDGDGDADILWRHDGGQVVTWEMEGGTLVTNHNLGTVSNSWQIRGTDDFDADGDADILWRHDDGMVVTWEMENGVHVTNHNLPNLADNWQISGTGDFDEDGDADILLRHDDGLVVVWHMEDGAYLANENWGVVPNGWQIRGIGEFDLFTG